jgi:hypothetical protein
MSLNSHSYDGLFSPQVWDLLYTVKVVILKNNFDR